jgi:hypothetical protein
MTMRDFVYLIGFVIILMCLLDINDNLKLIIEVLQK